MQWGSLLLNWLYLSLQQHRRFNYWFIYIHFLIWCKLRLWSALSFILHSRCYRHPFVSINLYKLPLRILTVRILLIKYIVKIIDNVSFLLNLVWFFRNFVFLKLWRGFLDRFCLIQRLQLRSILKFLLDCMQLVLKDLLLLPLLHQQFERLLALVNHAHKFLL